MKLITNLSSLLVLALLLDAAVADTPTLYESHSTHVAVTLFDVSFLACNESPCNALLVVRGEPGNPPLPAGAFVLVRIITNAGDKRLQPSAIATNPHWVMELVREPSCDRALKDFPPVRMHPAADEACFDASPFSSVGDTATVTVPHDQVLQCFTMTKLISQ